MEFGQAHLILKGVRQNNLKNISLELPLGAAVVVTGPSGSGKTSLAFETIYAEGQRRYMQSLSTYARQFLEKFRAPDADLIQNVPPTIALEQVNPVRNSRATVGTTTEINDYLRLLFEKIGTEYCAKCNLPMERLGYEDMWARLHKKASGKSVVLTFLKKLPGSGDQVKDSLAELLRSGYSRLILDGERVETEELLKRKKPPKEVFVILDRVKLTSLSPTPDTLTRFTESVRNAISFGQSIATVFLEDKDRFTLLDELTNQLRCPKCKALSQPKSSTSFSFNSPLGACEQCKGFGNTLEIDEDLIIPNPTISIARGAIDPFTKPSLSQWQRKLLQFCKDARIDADLPYRDLSEKDRKLVMNGNAKFKGVRGVFKKLEEEKYKMRIRVFISRYVSPFECTKCHGDRLNTSALQVRVGNHNISQVTHLTLEGALLWLKELKLTEKENKIGKDALQQLKRRLEILCSVGLGYITISRLTKTLSGGEYQRILLATQLSQGLTDTMYVLDEPSIGLHPNDTKKLLQVLNNLRAQGNSLILVEHDPEVIEWGEYILDMGPGSGSRGGEIIFNGDRQKFFKSTGPTARAVSNWKDECRHALLRPLPEKPNREYIEIIGAQGNNLKNIDVSIPLNTLVGITGVSGSGKSTLIVDTLYQALTKIFSGRSEKIARFESLSGFENLSGVELVDQSPIGRSSRSNPITFMKAYDEVRSLFANTPDALAKKLTPGHFSFNVVGGRCDNCDGEGRVKIDMVFMEDVTVPCQVCDEKRFKPTILSIKYRGKNIDQVLRMTVDEAYDFFKSIPGLRTKLSLLHEVGLGYIQLGQPGFSLSGGEAQRLKIARELGLYGVHRSPTLFILDEPTTGLHFNEITKLLSVLRKLIASGHSVVVIEHNLQFICGCDYLIDLGPDGGERGGRVVGVGTPKELAQKKLPHTSLYLSELL